MNSDILVSVCVVTYNQEKYIAECLESVINQKTNFAFEIIVGEDCSTDNTRAIVQQYVDKYPDLIKPIFHKKNIGTVENIKMVYAAAKGKYISHIDGDDLTLPDKLQKQFNALESNFDCIMCTHDMELSDEYNNRYKRSFSSNRKNVNSLFDLYEKLPFFAHSSKTFVNNITNDFWNNFSNETTDIELHVKQAKKGKIFHINEKLGVYRQSTGISTKNSKVNILLSNATRRIFEEALIDNSNDYEKINNYYAKSLFNYAYQSAIYGDKVGLSSYINESISISVFSKKQLIFYKMSRNPALVIKICRLRYYLGKFI
jgi:glycosyltransferase involved in cell wall biosynthesis